MQAAGRYALHEAFVLHRRHFRETSLLVDVFAREHGMLRLIAKGALRPTKTGRYGVLQPFVPVQLAWTVRGEPAVLTAAESLGNGYVLGGKTLLCGLYLNELLVRLLPSRDPYPQLFQRYQQALRQLQSGERLEQTLRLFELALLAELGYGLLLDCEATTGERIKADLHYEYRLEQGPVQVTENSHSITGAVLLGLRDGCLDTPAIIRDAKRLMRPLIQHQLGGKPLKSRELFKFTQFSEAQ